MVKLNLKLSEFKYSRNKFRPKSYKVGGGGVIKQNTCSPTKQYDYGIVSYYVTTLCQNWHFKWCNFMI